MKIGPSFGPSKGAESVSSVKSGSSRATREAGAGAAAGTSVQISDLSAKIAEMEAMLAKTDAFDVQKVDAIKQAISEGRFKVNPDQVADKLLASVRELLEGKR